jgi:hypothetical protein
MNTKQRDVIYQRLSGVIRRETSDLDSLQKTSARVLADRDVSNDPTLQSMIRSDLRNRQAELDQKLRMEQSQAAPPSTRTVDVPAPVELIPEVPPAQIREEFGQLVQVLSELLDCGEVDDCRSTLEKMKALHKRNPEVISAFEIGEFEKRVATLRVQIQKLTEEIRNLKLIAVKASHKGSKKNLVRSLRRLTAIHAAHPRLLDDSQLEDVRREVANAARERSHHLLTTKRLLDREGSVTAEIKVLADAVRNFHRVAIEVPDTSEKFHEAEAIYLRAIQEVRTYDTEWFSGVVLDMADLLAEWTVPPSGAKGHIDRFLDRISAGLAKIRSDMREITNEQVNADDQERDEKAP